MSAVEWWKWFWRFAVVAEVVGIGVGFLGMAIFSQPVGVNPADALQALTALSAQTVELAAAVVTFVASIWGLCVTLPVWVFAEFALSRRREKQEDRDQQEFVARLLGSEGPEKGKHGD